jgi:hypothetical protein
MTEKVLNLARHFAEHKKDKHGNRGFQVSEWCPLIFEPARPVALVAPSCRALSKQRFPAF